MGDEQGFIAIGHLVGSAIESEDIASGIGERSHAAAGTGAGRFGNGGCFALEGFAFVSGAGNEYSATTFAVGVAGRRGVPGDIDIALRIGGNGAAAIEAIRVSDDVALGFESCAGVIQACIEKRLFAIGGVVTWASVDRWVVSVAGVNSERERLAHTVPGDVNTAIFSNGELSAADRAHGHGGMWLSVNRQRFGKFVLPGFAADVEDVAAFRVAFEVNEVDDAFDVRGCLRLNAAA